MMREREDAAAEEGCHLDGQGRVLFDPVTECSTVHCPSIVRGVGVSFPVSCHSYTGKTRSTGQCLRRRHSSRAVISNIRGPPLAPPPGLDHATVACRFRTESPTDALAEVRPRSHCRNARTSARGGLGEISTTLHRRRPQLIPLQDPCRSSASSGTGATSRSRSLLVTARCTFMYSSHAARS